MRDQDNGYRRIPTSSALCAAALLMLLAPGWVAAKDWTPARVSIVEGSAAYEAAGDVDWTEVSVNLPILDGDRIVTHPDSRVEVDLGFGNFLRLGAETDVVFTRVQDDDVILELRQGDAILRIGDKRDFIVQTESGRFATNREGLYRLSADDRGVVQVVVRKGKARVDTPYGEETLRDNEYLVLDPRRDPALRTAYGYYPDRFDDWSERLDARYVRVESVRYVGGYYPGLYDLDYYGYWTRHHSWGWVWIPHVAIGWSPFRYGHWVHFSFGWTWVSYEPWGWLPYHYGYWGFYGGRWCWVPGGFRAWSPAVVNFYHFGDYVGWAPRLYPGVTVINRNTTIINNNTTIINGRGPDSDVIRRGLVVVRRDQFGRTAINNDVIVRNIDDNLTRNLRSGLPEGLERVALRGPRAAGPAARTGVARGAAPSARPATTGRMEASRSTSLSSPLRTRSEGVYRSRPATAESPVAEPRVYRIPSRRTAPGSSVGSAPSPLGPRTAERRIARPAFQAPAQGSGGQRERGATYVRPSVTPRSTPSLQSGSTVRIPSSRVQTPRSRTAPVPSRSIQRTPATRSRSVAPPPGYSAAGRSGYARPMITAPSGPTVRSASPPPAPRPAPSRPAPAARPRPDRH
ncbi:MAG: hypothetical protein Kow00109_27770 [Acidobacteriota bacterium]